MDSYTALVTAELRLVELVDTFDLPALDRHTPCVGWDVRALLSHTLAGIEVFAAAVDGDPAPTAEQMFGGVDLVGRDPVSAAKRATARSQAAWAGLADPDRPLSTILGEVPAGRVRDISAFATVVHTWDLAVATGQPATELPAELASFTADVAARFVSDLRAAGEHSLFRPELPAPPQATPTQRLMAFLGRDASR